MLPYNGEAVERFEKPSVRRDPCSALAACLGGLTRCLCSKKAPIHYACYIHHLRVRSLKAHNIP